MFQVPPFQSGAFTGGERLLGEGEVPAFDGVAFQVDAFQADGEPVPDAPTINVLPGFVWGAPAGGPSYINYGPEDEEPDIEALLV